MQDGTKNIIKRFSDSKQYTVICIEFSLSNIHKIEDEVTILKYVSTKRLYHPHFIA